MSFLPCPSPGRSCFVPCNAVCVSPGLTPSCLPPQPSRLFSSSLALGDLGLPRGPLNCGPYCLVEDRCPPAVCFLAQVSSPPTELTPYSRQPRPLPHPQTLGLADARSLLCVSLDYLQCIVNSQRSTRPPRADFSPPKGWVELIPFCHTPLAALSTVCGVFWGVYVPPHYIKGLNVDMICTAKFLILLFAWNS